MLNDILGSVVMKKPGRAFSFLEQIRKEAAGGGLWFQVCEAIE